MINRENKTIVNGKGSISLSVLLGPGILVEELEGEREPGTNVIDNPPETIDKKVFWEITKEDIVQINKDLDGVDKKKGGVIEFLDGWSLDFTNYNAESVKVYRECLDKLSDLLEEIDAYQHMADELTDSVVSVYGELMERLNANKMKVAINDEENKPLYQITVKDMRNEDSNAQESKE